MTREDQISRLRAAHKYWGQYIGEKSMYAHLHPPDLCVFDPLVKKPYYIPAGFIPEYVGGSIAVVQRGGGALRPVERESKEFIMHNFLPGGFKKRWEFKHWKADWRPSQNLPRAADITRTFEIGKSFPLGTIFSGSSFSSFGLPTTSTRVYFPETVYIEELQHAQKFYWNDTTYLLTSTKDPGTTHEVMRDPLSKPLFEHLILSTQGSDDFQLEIPRSSLLSDISFVDEFRVARCYYANCIELFTRGQPLTRIISFFHDQDNVHAIIATEHISQAVDFIMNLNEIHRLAMDILAMDNVLKNDLRLQCIRVLIYRKLFYEHQLLESSYDIDWVCGILTALDCWMKMEDSTYDIRRFFDLEDTEQQRVLYQIIPSVSEIRLRLAGYTSDHVEQFMSILDSFPGVLRSVVFSAYDDQIFGEFIDDVLGSTIEKTIQAWAQLVFSVGGEGLTFLHFSDVSEGLLHVYSYDSIQGGTGIAKEFFRKLMVKFQDTVHLNREFAFALQCEVDISDAVIHRIFSSYDTHFLAGVFSTDDRTQEHVIRNALGELKQAYGFSFREKVEDDIIAFTKRNCARLSSSDDLIALYHELTISYGELREFLQRTPTIYDLFLYQPSHRFYDPRAAGAFEYFRTMKKGDLSEIYSRISEILPVCVNACPECIDIENFYEKSFYQSELLEKRLLHKVLERIA